MFTNFNFNMTRIDEMQEEELQRNETYVKHQLTPRIVLEAIDEIRGRSLGFYDEHDPNGQEKWSKTWDKSIDLPTRSDIYAQKPSSFSILRTVTFLKTEREREMVIGEDYT